MMYKAKKTVAAALAVLLTGITGQAFAAEGFRDVKGNPYETQISQLREKGVVQGVKDGVFAPHEQITAAEGISLIINALRDKLGLETVKLAGPSSYFTHVSDDAWYAFAFSVAHYKGIEIPQDVDPNRPLTKEEFLYYLQQGIEATGQYPLVRIFINIVDTADLTTEYQGAIQRSLIMKIGQLDEDGKLHPQALLSRGEAAAYAFNAFSFVESHQPLPQPATK
jgi:hypothetical protein